MVVSAPKKIVPVLRLFREAFTNLKANDPVRMAGATSFFTFFALPPIVIMLSNVLSPVLNEQHQLVSYRLFAELSKLLGPRSANQLQDISQHLQNRPPTLPMTLVGFFLLLLASTTLFSVVKSSLNQLWNVRPKASRGFVHTLKDRGIALVIILFSGLLFSISLTIDQRLAVLQQGMLTSTPTLRDWLSSGGNYLLSVVIITFWFASVFNYLPDVRVPRRAVWVGALVTSVLFKVGELILNRLLINSQVANLYGASGSVILLLLFVFYSSLIFYYGASFTRTFARTNQPDPEPNATAVSYEITDLLPPNAAGTTDKS
ncbi:YihY/virulence factor BrkB family protein [Spirosoma sp. KUDC1026]|uniref:YihY/virulence factor BrkB family protein n=1 Tax=Spirosoma sp. KUDC1026 TaxID=2745947 RepID=UPI00159BCAB1|nr:YihY/virulence factor BrkB family protein [Spirosoma sp. KUDC1026]QKZ13809.1 YihY/virulence factor BrkB family protein [Spirosoma sp. KUDC1026]